MLQSGEWKALFLLLTLLSGYETLQCLVSGVSKKSLTCTRHRIWYVKSMKVPYSETQHKPSKYFTLMKSGFVPHCRGRLAKGSC